jgi:PKD repeat protein/DNA-binding MarR family transcriptional regulator
VLGAALPAGIAAERSLGFSVSVSYTPSSVDPLQITFTSTVFPGAPTGYNWSFGDGQYLNASGPNLGPGIANPVHRYAAGGTFAISVTVWEDTAAVTSTLQVVVVPAPLTATVLATALMQPFTFQFAVVVRGGSATYRSILWQFGDGHNGSGATVEYSYARPGEYHPTVNVTDSQGAWAVGGTFVNATGPAAPSEPTIDTAEWIALGIGATAGSMVTAFAGYVLLRRGRRARFDRASPAPRPLAGASAPPAPEPIGPATSAGTTAPPSREIVPPAASVDPGAAPSATAPAGQPTTEALRISQRIVLHLAAQGALGPDEVASPGFTQAGISRALGVRQNALTNVLRRLVAAEVVVEDVRHVRGQPRRLKVYRLTSRGQALARDLRTRRARARSEPASADAGT